MLVPPPSAVLVCVSRPVQPCMRNACCLCRPNGRTRIILPAGICVHAGLCTYIQGVPEKRVSNIIRTLEARQQTGPQGPRPRVVSRTRGIWEFTLVYNHRSKTKRLTKKVNFVQPYGRPRISTLLHYDISTQSPVATHAIAQGFVISAPGTARFPLTPAETCFFVAQIHKSLPTA